MLTKDQLQSLKVGQELFWENGENSRRYHSRKIVIDKIGNKYAYSGRTKISLEDGVIVSDYAAGNVWINEQEFFDAKNLEIEWTNLRMSIVNTYKCPSHLSIEKIRELIKTINK